MSEVRYVPYLASNQQYILHADHLAATAELRRELEEVKRQLWGAERRVVNLETERNDYSKEARKAGEYIRRLGVLLGCADGDDLPEHRIDTLKREVEELRRDKVRLDWLENPDAVYFVEVQTEPHGEYIHRSHPPGLRQAIDAALNQREK